MEKLPADVTAVESRVQVDGKAITSRGAGTGLEFAVTLVEQLYGKDKAEEVATPMVSYYVLRHHRFLINYSRTQARIDRFHGRKDCLILVITGMFSLKMDAQWILPRHFL